MNKAPTVASSFYWVSLFRYYDSNHGGKSGAKFDQTWAIRAVCRAAGSDFHRLLDFSSYFPRTRLLSPLSTTLYHILAVSRLLSRRNLRVRYPLVRRFGKARSLVVYR